MAVAKMRWNVLLITKEPGQEKPIGFGVMMWQMLWATAYPWPQDQFNARAQKDLIEAGALDTFHLVFLLPGAEPDEALLGEFRKAGVAVAELAASREEATPSDERRAAFASGESVKHYLGESSQSLLAEVLNLLPVRA